LIDKIRTERGPATHGQLGNKKTNGSKLERGDSRGKGNEENEIIC